METDYIEIEVPQQPVQEPEKVQRVFNEATPSQPQQFGVPANEYFNKQPTYIQPKNNKKKDGIELSFKLKDLIINGALVLLGFIIGYFVGVN